jgi:hypothetical protein
VPDPRRPVVLALILEWDPEADRLDEHLGMTPEEFSAWKATGALSPGYRPREPREIVGAPINSHQVKARRPPTTIVPRETQLEMAEMARAGCTRTEIAARTKFSRSTVHRVLVILAEEVERA